MAGKQYSLLSVALILLLLSACGGRQVPPPETVLPVKTIKLKPTRPQRLLRLTGSAKAWREEQLAFEVNGRVKSVVDDNAKVGIHAEQDQDGKIKIVGQVIAQLDSARYQAEVASARANLASANAEVKALEIEIARVVPQDIKSAHAKITALEITIKQYLPNELAKMEAQLNLARSEYRRSQDLYSKNAGTEQTFEKCKNQLQAAQSAYNQVKANIITKERDLEAADADLAKVQAAAACKRARLAVAKARLKMAQAQLQLALRNLKDCQLRTPFSGVISARMVSRGAVVNPSRPVVTVTMMDPIQIEIAVSAEMARKLQSGDPVQVFPSTLDLRAISGWIEKKSVMADPRTRTYTITCMARNRLITPRGGDYQPKSGYISREDIALIWNMSSGTGSNNLMIAVNSIDKDDNGYFAWTIKDFTISQRMRPSSGSVSKVYFQVGNVFSSFLAGEFREILKPNGLRAQMLTLRKDFPGLKPGMPVYYVPTDWMIRPGDLVQVSFDLGALPTGIYVPVEAILNDKSGYYIFINESGSARKQAVSVHETFRTKRRIQASINLEGKELIVSGAHYVTVGAKVISTAMEEH